MKGKVYKMTVRPLRVCMDPWFGDSGTDKKAGGRLKLLRFVLGVTRMDRIRNEHIKGTA